MSIDYFLFRASPNKDKQTAIQELPSFGNQEEVVQRLCSSPGFKLSTQKRINNDKSWAFVNYFYSHVDGQGRGIEFALQGDPVDCISVKQAYKEDFLPVTHVLTDLAPFEIMDIEGVLVSPDELSCSFNDWIQENYKTNNL
ncbi:hypothetical protein ACKFKG_13445 [Phormidesmis sp. 146-35]